MPRTLMIQGLRATWQAKLAAANFAPSLSFDRLPPISRAATELAAANSSCLLLHVKRETVFSRPACRHCGAGRNPFPRLLQSHPKGTRRFVLSHRFPDVVLEPSRTRNRRPGDDEPEGRWRPLSGLVHSARRLELVKIVGRGLRLGGGGDDSALVVLQDGEPTCQVGGGVIARIMSHAEIGAKE